jgi:NADPH-dependent ferric siderophore reductase
MTQRFDAATVVAARSLSPGIRNVTIASEALTGFAFEPGADVRIRLPPCDDHGEERRYSVWKSNARAGTLDICVVQHGAGTGSRWAARCAPGDAVAIALSQVLPIALDHAARTHLFFGDDTSLASAEALMRTLPAHAVTRAWFEVGASDRRWPAGELVRPETVDWVDRAGRPGAALLAHLAAQTLPQADGTTAYVTGEAWLCAMVHSHLVRARGLRREAVRAMPYWKLRPVVG